VSKAIATPARRGRKVTLGPSL